jgi:phospholipid/cholesterol/gamma-HCH transport system substrate-binding protein
MQKELTKHWQIPRTLKSTHFLNNREKGSGDKLKLGIFVTAGTVLFVMAMYYIGNKQNLFGSNYRVSAMFTHVSGLQKGNNVRYSGIDVGTVNEIRIVNDTSIYVEMVLKEDIMNFIRTDAIATIGTDGLMGDQLINISPGSPDSPLVSEYDTLITLDRIDSDRMLRRLGQTGSNVEIISVNLMEIVEKINSGKGLLGQMVNDPSLASHLEQTLNNLNQVSESLSNLSLTLEESIRDGKGSVGTLLNDTTMAGNIRRMAHDLKEASANLDKSTSDLNVLVAGVKDGKGTAGAVLTDSNMVISLEESLENVRQGTAAFNENMEAMRSNWLFRAYFKDKEKEAKKAAKNKTN